LIGSELVSRLRASGIAVRRMVRSRAAPEAGDARWNPSTGEMEAGALDGVTAVVHLAGESIATGRWTAAKKDAIRRSRVHSTRLLCEGMAKLQSPPAALLCASAVGYYGNRGAERLTEESPAGSGFLAGVCVEWEGAADVARQRGIRVVNLRFGAVLSPRGGALAKLAGVFRMGGGGRVGDGSQYMSWASLEDAVSAIIHLLERQEVRGPVNVASPGAVTNVELVKTLGKVLHRPTMLPLPAFAARLAFGEMADELLLASQRVEPAKLLASGFAFRHRELEPALRELLGSPAG